MPGTDVAALLAGLRRQAGDRPLIVLADVPDEEEALAALAAGASGYCNGHAAPAVLTQVGLAVGVGGHFETGFADEHLAHAGVDEG